MTDQAGPSNTTSAPQGPRPQVSEGDWDTLATSISGFSVDPNIAELDFSLKEGTPGPTGIMSCELLEAFIQGKRDYLTKTLTAVTCRTDQPAERMLKLRAYQQGFDRAEHVQLAASASSRPEKEVRNKVADPEYFYGEPPKFLDFKAQLQLKF